MEMIWSYKIDEILRIGKFLNDVGVHNWALTKSQALDVLRQFLDFQISVFGGDVYEDIDGIIQPNYDSWHCDPLPGEASVEFVQRSVTRAKNYIESYKAVQPDRIFFTLVPYVQLEK